MHDKAGRQLSCRWDRLASPAGQNRRAQFSLELLLVTAAYFALLATFIAAENKAGLELAAAEKAFSNRTQASLACFFLDFFSLDARNTAMRLDKKPIAGAGHTIDAGGERATCLAELAVEDEVRVKQNGREPA